jgi:putative redox protein
MIVHVKRINNDFHMEATNDTGNTVHMDGNPAIGGHNLGARPMQLLLMGVGGCSSIDVISILRKQRVEPTSIDVEIRGDRNSEEVPSLFKKIHVVFKLGGLADDQKPKAVKAAALSMEKYCSVSKMLENTAEITHEVEFI